MVYINRTQYKMKIYQLNQNNLAQIAYKIALFLRSGAVVVIPTETCYGLAVDFNNAEALERLYRLKQRPNDLKLPICVPDVKTAKNYASIDKKVESWLEKHLPNSFTLIVNSKADFILKYSDIGFRFSNNIFVNQLSQEMGAFALTSANVSGYPETYNLRDLEAQFAGKIFQPDIFVNIGDLVRVPPTTIIDYKTKKPKIIRQGLFEIK